MTRTLTFRALVLACVALVTLPAVALAQQGITGQVTDNTGGVLPGVTVTVTGDAITGAPPVAFTDGQGQFAIPGLPLGTFTVTFTLPGFSTLVREGIELPAQFTANLNEVMTVGGLEETVTVSGESPIVDVQSAARTEVINRDTLDSLPTPREHPVDRLPGPGCAADPTRRRRRADDGAGPDDGQRRQRPPPPPCRWTAWSSTRRWPTATS